MFPGEFNNKYKDHLEEGHYGLGFHNPEVTEYLDKEFGEAIKADPKFSFSQIKIKWNDARVYCSDRKLATKWEAKINEIINKEHKHQL